MWIGFVFTVVSSWEENERNEMAVLIKVKARKQVKAVLLFSIEMVLPLALERVQGFSPES